MESIGCTVRIVTKSEGVTRTFQGFGTFFPAADAFTVRYTDDSDEVLLSFKDGALSMERSGAVCLAARFRLREETEFLMTAGGLHGSLPVITTELGTSAFPDRILCTLSYLLGRGEEAVSYLLQISITFPEGS